MAKVGFRIVYVPEPEDTWEAVSAMASWVEVFISCVGVLASFLAIWYAIQVPKKIADKQDQIALFEKRYECFQFYEACLNLLNLSLDDKNNEIISQVCTMFGVQSVNELNQHDFVTQVNHFEFLLHEMSFLFPEIQEEDIGELHRALLSYLSDVWKRKDFEESKQKFIQAMAKVGKYTDEIWDSMTISNI